MFHRDSGLSIVPPLVFSDRSRSRRPMATANGLPTGTARSICMLLMLYDIASASPLERMKLGWREKVIISPNNFEMIGKLDTGADRTSIHAQNIIITGDKVSFTTTNFRGEQLNVVRPLLSSTLIKRHGYKSQARPVINLGFCIGNRYIEGKVSLTDRSRYSTTLLLGREILQHIAVVDPSVEMQVTSVCPDNTPKAHEKKKSKRK